MNEMRVGAPGAEKPTTRIDDQTHVDRSDVVDEFDEQFFGGGGLPRIASTVSDQAAAGQVNRGQSNNGKSAETINPAGPWLVTSDEVDDALDLDMWLDVDGTGRQSGNTQTMIFDPYFIAHYLIQLLALEPGDAMELGAEGLGSQPQRVPGPR